MNNIHLIFENKKNSWLKSSKNVFFFNNILEAHLDCGNGTWKYNKIEIHPLLLNKNLINNYGIFKYGLSSEEDATIMNQLFPNYNDITIPFINIKKCVILSVDNEKYNNIRNDTIAILNNYKLPPISTFFGYTKNTSINSKFYKFLYNKNQRNELTLGMLEIFENFINESVGNEWLLYFEDDVRPINIDKEQDLTKLYNVPNDAELIRPYIGLNETCDITNVNYKYSYSGGNNHAFYISTIGCIKVLNYTKKYKWKYICDIDLYKLAKKCGMYPTGYDNWSLAACNGNNDISDKLNEDEKINMYHLSHCIFNQTSNPCC